MSVQKPDVPVITNNIDTHRASETVLLSTHNICFG